MITIVKLGGTSVGDSQSIKNAVSIITGIARTSMVVVVVSAMAGVSNELSDMIESTSNGAAEIEQFISKLRARHSSVIDSTVLKENKTVKSVIENLLIELSELLLKLFSGTFETHVKYSIMSMGEKLSAPVLSAAINEVQPSSYHYGDDRLVFTDSYFKSANCLTIETEMALKARLLPEVENGIIPVLTGFIGCTVDGRTTTLGRGSSDYLASIVGAALNAAEIQIWTDVDGILTADPRVVEGASLIDKISYSEAYEIAYFGAKVLHPKTITPAVQKKIPIRIKNSRNPDSPGTLIISKVERTTGKPTAITCKKDIILIDLHSTAMVAAYGYLAGIFEVFKTFSISVDMISTTEVSVSLTIDNLHKGSLEPVLEELGKFARVRAMKNKALICVIGEGLKSSPGLTGRIFSCLGDNGININCISMGASEMNISFVVDNSETDRAIRILHEALFSEIIPPISIYSH
jgi:aspartate kinase